MDEAPAPEAPRAAPPEPAPIVVAPVPALAPASGAEQASWILMAAALLFVLRSGLVPALLAGLAVCACIRRMAAQLAGERLSHGRARLVVVTLFGGLTIGAVGGLTLLLVAFLKGKVGDLPLLLDRMAAVMESIRDRLGGEIPHASTTDLQGSIATGLREHARELRDVGAEVGRLLMHTLVGMVIGAMVVFDTRRPAGAFLIALGQRILRLERAFEQIVFAQVKISGLNAFLTGIYLLVVLPLFGVHLPLRKTLVVVTFLAGLIPIAGNLISNTIITVISLGTSPGVALASLAFLVIVHKLEYFVNARIVGDQIQAAAWEMLLAIFVLEAAFGLQGVLAAPVLYAYLKAELAARRLID